MEHRWGERVSVHLTVELSCGSLPPVTGSLENVSASGAFVRTRGRRLPRGPVEVLFVRLGAHDRYSARLPAYIVRESEAGVGIEWSEFAPRAVRELVIRGRRARATRARSVSPLRRGAREPDAALEPRAAHVTSALPQIIDPTR